jgi:hypothetical protein
MADGARLHDREVLRAHRIAIQAFAERSGGAVDAALGKLTQAAAEAQRSVDRWTQQMVEAERDVHKAELDLDSCLAEEQHNCNSEARTLERAQRWLDECERNLELARRSRSMLETAAQQFRTETQRFRQALARDGEAAAAFLGSLSAAADEYAGTSVGAGGGFAGGRGGPGASAATPGAAPPASLPSIGETDLVEVPLDRIDTSDSGVKGPESFSKVPYATMRNGVQRLDEVVLPAVRRGADSAYFAHMDARLGLDYEHGYQRVYEAFFGSDSLRLDARTGGDFGVTNGFHRIHVARELGLSSLPAHVARWRGRR